MTPRERKYLPWVLLAFGLFFFGVVAAVSMWNIR